MTLRTALVRNGIALAWPGKPVGDRPTPLAATHLRVWERWPATSEPETAPSAAATLVASDALAVLDAWHHGDTASPASPVRLIYLDPPFATGTTFAAEIPIGERRPNQPTLRLPAYRDIWTGGLPGYLTFMFELLTGLRAVLADDGWLCLHCDHRTSAHLRLILDEVFGPEAFRNEIVWSYGLGNGTSRRGFPRKHDTLLLYAKSDAARFTAIRGEVSPAMANKYRHVRADGTRYLRSYGREYDLKGGKPVGSVWEIPSVAPTSRERTGFPTQKPLALLERLISATTSPGDTVLDPCCGSGTTLLAATRLGRSAVGVDSSPLAITASRTRLVRHGIGLDLLASDGMGDVSPPRNGQPMGGLAAAPPRHYHLRARAELSPVAPETSARQLTVALSGLSVSAMPQAASLSGALAIQDGRLVRSDAAVVLTNEWIDWIDGWAVHPGGDCGQPHGPFTIAGSSLRTGRERSIATTLSMRLPGDDVPRHLTLRLYDVFGAWSDHLVPLDHA